MGKQRDPTRNRSNDVEYWQPRDFTALAAYAFGPREREAVALDGISAFYQIWTLREAMAKATGEGLIATINGLDRVADTPAFGCWANEAWRTFYTLPQAKYSLAIASESKSIWSAASLTHTDVTSFI